MSPTSARTTPLIVLLVALLSTVPVTVSAAQDADHAAAPMPGHAGPPAIAAAVHAPLWAGPEAATRGGPGSTSSQAPGAAVTAAMAADPSATLSVLVELTPELVRSGAPSAAEPTADLEREIATLGGHIHRRFASLPVLAVEIEARRVDGLARLPQVRSVEPDRVLDTHLDVVVDRIVGTDQVLAAAASARGVDGAGWGVAVLDTGVDRDHPFLADVDGTSRVVAEACFSTSGDCPNGRTRDQGTGAAAPLRDSRHGTHVAGIAAGGRGSIDVPGVPARGVAPRAEVLAAQIFSTDEAGRLVSYSSDLLAGLDWVNQLRHEHDVAAVNLSLGTAVSDGQPGWTGACDDHHHVSAEAIERLRSEGILTVVATGNDGDTEEVGFPACLSGVVAVGSSDGVAAISSFSNLNGLTDVVAPGEKVSSSVPGGYQVFSGTSMASPVVAGAVALLRDLAPDAAPDEGVAALRSSRTWIDDRRVGGVVTHLPQLDVELALADLEDGAPPSDQGPGDGTGRGFDDVPVSHPHREAIDWLAREGVTTGCTDDGRRFCPDAPVDRAQMASFLARTLELPEGPRDTFVDVSRSHPHAGTIGAVAREGVTLGCTKDGARYCPHGLVTRGQMASFLTRAFDLETDAAAFSDVAPTHPHAATIGAMARAGITSGCGRDPLRYCPDASVTRAQMARFLYNAAL